MTDEENINSIVKEVVIFGDELPVEALKYALSLMAKRKDEQFKNYLQLTKLNCNASAKTVYAYDMSSAYELEIMAKCCDEILNKFFNKVEHRKILEQTPITEEWLIEQGFVVSDELHSKRDKIYVKNEIKVFLDVDHINGTVRNADCIEINGNSYSFHKDNYDNRHEITLADLMDAIEICK